MAVLRHEGWEFDRSSGFGVSDGRPGQERFLHATPGRLLHVVYAATIGEAMGEHYRLMGWGAYAPIPGVTDVPYSDDELAAQLEQHPEDEQLRRLNRV